MPEQIDPREPLDLYNQIIRPTISMGLAAGRPKGFTPAPGETAPTGWTRYEPPLVPERPLKSADIFGPASQGYNDLRRMGVTYNPSVARDMVATIQRELEGQMGMGVDINAPVTWKMTEKFAQRFANTNHPITLDELDSFKRGLDISLTSTGPGKEPEHLAAIIAKHTLNDELTKVNPADMHINRAVNSTVTPQQVIDRLNQVRGGWAVGKRMEMYQDAMKLAENKGGDMVEKLKTAASTILNKPKLMVGMPADEADALRQIAAGGPKWVRAARWLGQVSPQEGLRTGWLPLAIDALTGAAGGIPGAATAVTAGAHEVAKLGTRAQWDKLLAQTARKTPVPTGIVMTPRPPSYGSAALQATNIAREYARQQNQQNPPY